MTYITVAFSHDKSDWISRIMAWLTFAKYSHVALIRGDEVIEASGVGHPAGVRKITLDTYLAKHPGTVIRKIGHAYPKRTWEWAESRIGVPYDYYWLWGYLAHRRNWQDPDKFTCAELIAWACEQAGDPLFTGDYLWNVSPNMLYLISKELPK